MSETFDIAIVGAGITGCAIARQLARFDLSICVVEAANDIALGASKANGGLVHAGYDPAPGTVKAQVNARGCELYGTWAQELGFLFGSVRPGLTFRPVIFLRLHNGRPLSNLNPARGDAPETGRVARLALPFHADLPANSPSPRRAPAS